MSFQLNEHLKRFNWNKLGGGGGGGGEGGGEITLAAFKFLMLMSEPLFC